MQLSFLIVPFGYLLTYDHTEHLACSMMEFVGVSDDDKKCYLHYTTSFLPFSVEGSLAFLA